MKLVFLGPPGAGKGTQATIIAEKLGIHHISTGAMLREAVAHGTDTGLKVKDILKRGELVPDDLMCEIVKERLVSKDLEAGYILDGFPRTVDQAEVLDKFLATQNTHLNGVISFEISEEVLFNRLLDRAKKEGRADDKPEVIRNRLEVYKSQTQPLIQYYANSGQLNNVKAEGQVEDITEGMLSLDLFLKVFL